LPGSRARRRGRCGVPVESCAFRGCLRVTVGHAVDCLNLPFVLGVLRFQLLVYVHELVEVLGDMLAPHALWRHS
jgi:hypothetical protein